MASWCLPPRLLAHLLLQEQLSGVLPYSSPSRSRCSSSSPMAAPKLLPCQVQQQARGPTIQDFNLCSFAMLKSSADGYKLLCPQTGDSANYETKIQKNLFEYI